MLGRLTRVVKSRKTKQWFITNDPQQPDSNTGQAQKKSFVKKSNFIGEYTKDQEEPIQNKILIPKENYQSRRENIIKKNFPLAQEEKIKDQGEASFTKSSKIPVKSSPGKMFEFTESEVR